MCKGTAVYIMRSNGLLRICYTFKETERYKSPLKIKGKKSIDNTNKDIDLCVLSILSC